MKPVTICFYNKRCHSSTGIQNNNIQPSPQNEKRSKLPIVVASVLAIAGVALGIAIAVYLEMLAVGIAVGAICCLIAAAIVYYCFKVT